MRTVQYLLLSLAIFSGLNTSNLMASEVLTTVFTAPSVTDNPSSNSRSISIGVVEITLFMMGALFNNQNEQMPIYNQIELPEADEYDEDNGAYEQSEGSKIELSILVESNILPDFDPEASMAESQRIRNIVELITPKEYETVDRVIPPDNYLLDDPLNNRDDNASALVIDVTFQRMTNEEANGSPLDDSNAADAYCPELEEMELEHFKQELERCGFSQSESSHFTSVSFSQSVIQGREVSENQPYVDDSEVSTAIIYCPIRDGYTLTCPSAQTESDKYICPECNEFLDDAVQPPCGHWICESCIKYNIECPKKGCNEVYTKENRGEFYPDNFVRRAVKELAVSCNKGNCTWKGKVPDIKKHDRENHLICPLAPFGCGAKQEFTIQALRAHVNDEVVQHTTILCELLLRYNKVRSKGAADSGGASVAAMSLVDRGNPDGSDCPTQAAALSLVERDGPASTRTNGRRTTSLTSDEITRETLDRINSELEQLLNTEFRKTGEEIAELTRGVTEIEKAIRKQKADYEDRDFRLSLLENGNHEGFMTWRIPQFSQRMADAQSGRYTSIFSLPFFTGRYGFKMCLRLYILGDGAGKNTHMSMLFHIMKGEFDNIQVWPFTHRVTFKLINQRGGRDILDGFEPDPLGSSFSKPKSDMNRAVGCTKFVSHSDLKNGGYIVEDTVFIKCNIDMSSVRNP